MNVTLICRRRRSRNSPAYLYDRDDCYKQHDVESYANTDIFQSFSTRSLDRILSTGRVAVQLADFFARRARIVVCQMITRACQ